ncbi:hypothetical protein GS11_0809 [Mycobacterium tuberculosis variant bovis BCG]|nr:hypothetical protein BCGT_0542 [Mycobacterium tuberculosis variant bovis BCG str. ATCC 35743]AKO23735.1 hypothetical protein GS11_0809 [Mycobacterium tuberculosis variant bovis BCG]ALA77145.1 Uncharacterized protein BCGR_0828 [Mycobacterium tuberculosis variant bovis BCG]KAF3415610.1 hypothetical protein BIT17_0139 [Mycobacterium tuberculosis variant bovis]
MRRGFLDRWTSPRMRRSGCCRWWPAATADIGGLFAVLGPDGLPKCLCV